MLTWLIPLGRIRGTAIRVHVTLVLLVAWYAWQGWKLAGVGGAVDQFLFLALLFLSVTLHEFGHITAARRYGIATPDVLLTPIGGIARMARMPSEPRQELVVALAGPAVTLAIAALLSGGIALFHGPAALLPTTSGQVPLWTAVAWTNIVLLAFNLLPAFPMDGGRVLRALLASRIGMVRGTRIAARIGQALALGLAFLGLQGNVMLVLIAIFVYLGAEAEYNAVREATLGRMAILSDSEVRLATPGQSMRDLVEKNRYRTQPIWPVVDANRRLLGRLTQAELQRAVDRDMLDMPVEAHLPLGSARDRIRADASTDEVIAQVLANPDGALTVVDEVGHVVAIVSRERVIDALLSRRVATPPGG